MAKRAGKSVGIAMLVLVLGGGVAGWYFLMGPGSGGGEFGDKTVVIGSSAGDDGWSDVTHELMEEAVIGDSRRCDIVAGKRELAVSQRVSGSGGRVVVDDDGLAIDVPAGAYERPMDFTVWKAPVQRFSGPAKAVPVSDLIYVENGGEYSDEPMRITFPVHVPEGHFAMPFVYDPDTGELDGLPVVSSDATSVTALTRHFSIVLMLRVALIDLEDSVESTFKIKRDSWRFPNPGVWYSPDGLCSGMSLGAAWYFRNRTAMKTGPLYMQLDNNMPFRTPSYDWDDTRGLRFVSAIQVRDDQMDSSGIDVLTFKLKADKKGYYQSCWRSFITALAVTKRPQYAAVYSEGKGACGHAILAWRASISERRLYVYDPNFPTNTNSYIQFTDDGVEPFVSAANHGKYAVDEMRFTEVYHLLGRTMISDGDLAQAWRESATGINGIGGDMGYELWVTNKDGDEIPLADGYSTGAEELSVKLNGLPGQSLRFDSYTLQGGVKPPPGVDAVVKPMGDALSGTEGDWMANPIPLKEGENILGFLVEAKRKDGDGNVAYRWVDFRWVRVYRTMLTVLPVEQSVSMGTPCEFRAEALGAGKSPKSYQWSVDEVVQPGAGDRPEARFIFDAVGHHTVSVDAIMPNDSVASAKAVAMVGDVTIKVTTGLPVQANVKASYEVTCRYPPRGSLFYRWHFPGRSVAETTNSGVRYVFSKEGTGTVRVEVLEKSTRKLWGAGSLLVAVVNQRGQWQRPEVDWSRAERHEVGVQNSVRDVPGEGARRPKMNMESADARRLQQERMAMKNKLQSLIDQGKAMSVDANQALNRIEEIDGLLWE